MKVQNFGSVIFANLTTYPITIKYIHGKKNIADFLSRFSVTKQSILSQLDFHAFSVAVEDSTPCSALIPQANFPKLTHLTDEDMQTIYSHCTCKAKQNLIDLLLGKL
jgi:hypothetical protein